MTESITNRNHPPLCLFVSLAAITLASFQPRVFAEAAAQFAWVKQAGSTNTDSSFGVAVDGAGNVLVCGYFESTATIGNTNLTSNGYDDVFLAKYDRRGNFLWARSGGGPTMPPA